jgi:hypothetical protein
VWIPKAKAKVTSHWPSAIPQQLSVLRRGYQYTKDTHAQNSTVGENSSLGHNFILNILSQGV